MLAKYQRVMAAILVVSLLIAVTVALRLSAGPLSRQATEWIAAATVPRNNLDNQVLDKQDPKGSVTYLIVGSDRRLGLPALGT